MAQASRGNICFTTVRIDKLPVGSLGNCINGEVATAKILAQRDVGASTSKPV